MRTAIFVDHENLSIAARNRGIGIDWYNFKEYLAGDNEGRSAIGAFCYVALDPRGPNAKDREIDRLWDDGWLVKTKVGAPSGPDRYKCNVDVEMAMDMIFFANDARPDIMVMVTGDQDFAPVVIKLRERGIRVEVAAFPESLSKVLLNASSGYINLDKWINEPEDESEEKEEETGVDDSEADFEKEDMSGNGRFGKPAVREYYTRDGNSLPKSSEYAGDEDVDDDY